jgi:hypothetical protein
LGAWHHGLMNKLRFCFLNILAVCVFCPLGLLAFRVAAKAHGLSRLRVGKLLFWGEPAFLDLCKSSIERLRTLDSDLWQILTRGRWVWVYQERHDVGSVGPPFWLFNMDPAYVAWQSEGVIARLVYIAFCISIFCRRGISEDKGPSPYGRAVTETKSWLEARGFPQPLIACYGIGNSKT